MARLAKKTCKPCEGGATPLAKDQALALLKGTTGWHLDETGKVISRDFVTKNFLAAVSFIQKIAEVAERENHHPDIHLTGYKKVRVELTTHAIKGLSENDFIVAAKVNELELGE